MEREKLDVSMQLDLGSTYSVQTAKHAKYAEAEPWEMGEQDESRNRGQAKVSNTEKGKRSFPIRFRVVRISRFPQLHRSS